MPRRMSNRDRIERMREEAEAKAKEKVPPKEPKSPRAKAAAAPAGRMKIVWAVCAVNGSIVRTFPYPQRDAAEAEVRRLSEETQAPHHLRAERVPFDV